MIKEQLASKVILAVKDTVVMINPATIHTIAVAKDIIIEVAVST